MKEFTEAQFESAFLARNVKKLADDKAQSSAWNDRDEVYREIFEQAENFKKYRGAS